MGYFHYHKHLLAQLLSWQWICGPEDMQTPLGILGSSSRLDGGLGKPRTWEMSSVCYHPPAPHSPCKLSGTKNTGDASPSHNYLGRNVIASSVINSILIHSLFVVCSHTCWCRNEHSIMVCYLLKTRPAMLCCGHPQTNPCSQLNPRLGRAFILCFLNAI